MATKITVNGKTMVVDGNHIRVSGNQVIADGQTVSLGDGKVVAVAITIVGDVQVLDSEEADVTVQGNVGTVRSTNGNVRAGNVTGNIETRNGNVTCGHVQGDVSSRNGNVLYGAQNNADLTKSLVSGRDIGGRSGRYSCPLGAGRVLTGRQRSAAGIEYA